MRYPTTSSPTSDVGERAVICEPKANPTASLYSEIREVPRAPREDGGMMPILKLVVKTIKLDPVPAGLSINFVLNSSIKPLLRLRSQPKNHKPTLSNSTTKCTSLVPSSPSASWPPPPSLAPLASGDAATRTVSKAPMAQFTSATRPVTGSCPLSAAVGPAARSTPTTPTRTVSARVV